MTSGQDRSTFRLLNKECNKALSESLLQCTPKKKITDVQLAKLLASFPYLARLNLAGCSRLTDQSLLSIKNLLRLKVLNMGEIPCSPISTSVLGFTDLSPVGELTRLKKLDLRGCRNVDPESLVGLSSLVNVKEFFLFEGQISESTLDAIGQMTSLEDLYLGSSFSSPYDNVSQALVYVIPGLPKLRYLDLSWNYLGVRALSFLCDWTRERDSLGLIQSKVEVVLEGVKPCFGVLSVKTLMLLLNPEVHEGLHATALMYMGSEAFGEESVDRFLGVGGLPVILELVNGFDFDGLVYNLNQSDQRVEFLDAGMGALLHMAKVSSEFHEAAAQLGVVPLLCRALSRGDWSICGWHIDFAHLVLALCQHSNEIALNAAREAGGIESIVVLMCNNPFWGNTEGPALAEQLVELRDELDSFQKVLKDLKLIEGLLLHLSENGVSHSHSAEHGMLKTLTILVEGCFDSQEICVEAGGMPIILTLLGQSSNGEVALDVCTLLAILVDPDCGAVVRENDSVVAVLRSFADGSFPYAKTCSADVFVELGKTARKILRDMMPIHIIMQTDQYTSESE